MSELETVGIIGTGNMGEAIAGGLAQTSEHDPENIYIFDILEEKMNNIAKKYNLQAADSPRKLAEEVDFVILAVKPSVIDEVLGQISGYCARVVSIAAGIKIEDIAAGLESEAKVIRIMPNTPCQVGEGMSFISRNEYVGDNFLEKVVDIFQNLGQTREIDEKLMDSATALGGSGPAYVFYFLEALQEAGVYLGFDADTSRAVSLQVLKGAVEIAEKTGKSPARLRQEVSSPGGTTVEALKHLDEKATRGIIEEALNQARLKSVELGEKSEGEPD
ncbi:MAG: pyrroline-5-carboxylate reductase [bacterium]